MNSIRKLFIALIAISGLRLADLHAQLPVPVYSHMPAPFNIDFHGQWMCTDGTSIARIAVRQRHRRNSGLDLSSHWTELFESQEGIRMRYFAGYDRDTNKLLLVDTDDPAVIAFSTNGWRGTHLELESIDRDTQLFPPYHILYDLKSSRRFMVTWEVLDNGKWKKDPSFTCNKSDHSNE